MGRTRDEESPSLHAGSMIDILLRVNGEESRAVGVSGSQSMHGLPHLSGTSSPTASMWWTAGHAKWPVPLSSTVCGIPMLFVPLGGRQASAESGISCGALSAVGTLFWNVAFTDWSFGYASFRGRTGRLRRMVRNPLRFDRFLHYNRTVCHLNASVGNSQEAVRTVVCSSPCRLHHLPVRHSVPTASVGTLSPHGKAGVFDSNLYNTRQSGVWSRALCAHR
jgi:hypothetical protein